MHGCQHGQAWGTPGGLPSGVRKGREGKQLLSNLPGARDSSKGHPTAPLFSPQCCPGLLCPKPLDQQPTRGTGPDPRVLCTSPSTGPVEPEGPTSGNSHSSTPPALNTPRSPNRRDGRQPGACCCKRGAPALRRGRPTTLTAPPRCAACPQAGLRRELEPVHPAATSRTPCEAVGWDVSPTASPILRKERMGVPLPGTVGWDGAPPQGFPPLL